MNIRSIHIVPTVHHEASGPSYSVTRLCEALNETGSETRLAVLELLPASAGHDFIKPFSYGLGPKRLGVSPGMKAWLHEQAASGRVRIMHNHSLWMLPNLYPAQAVRGTSCKLVVSPQGTLSKTALQYSRLLKRVIRPLLVNPPLREASAFHATSEQEYLDIRKQGLRQPVAILPNGVDLQDYIPGPTKPIKRLLYLGRIHPIKGIDNLLTAWCAVQDRFPESQLVIAGPGNVGYLKEMKALARELRLKRCEFPGSLYGNDKQQAYRDADLYVLPTHSENFGMTVAEALAAETPVITTTGAPWQGLEREGAGWWIDIGAEPLVAALEKALSLPPERLAQMGRKGREWMARDFSWEKIAADMARFYEWLLHGGPMPSFVRTD